jgi:hypothetical protein
VSPALPVLVRLVYSTDDEVLVDACWALAYLSEESNDRIQAVLETGVCRRVLELLKYVCMSACPHGLPRVLDSLLFMCVRMHAGLAHTPLRCQR